MTTVLDSIVVGVREDLEVRKSAVSLDVLRGLVQVASPALDVARRLSATTFNVISEVKRASPSKGHLADIADPAELAKQYELGGAATISVLTEARRFNGSLADLDSVRAAVRTPLLRKDFMVDEYQFWEARAHGADMILLIVASLSDQQLNEYFALTNELGMASLIEVHDEAELERALAISPQIVGVNARNLKTLDVDLATCHRVIPHIPKDVVAIAESGISTIEQVRDLAASGARGVLVGEALVTGGTPAQTVQEWTQAGAVQRELSKS
jgi:indole-3-glycerol phosphate synthase